MKLYQITPVPKPRQTRSDVWKKRPAVMRYREFADQARLLRIRLPESGANVEFNIPMPTSWSVKKKEQMNLSAHQQRPDLSNLLKALEDAIYGDDSHIWHYRSVCKLWAYEGSIRIW